MNALGYAHPRLTKVIREQAGLIIHTSNLYYHEYQGPLAERIAKASGLDRCSFRNSGTESMEGALKMARSHGRKINPGKDRADRSGKFVSRAHVRRAVDHGPGKIPPRFRAAADRRETSFRGTTSRRWNKWWAIKTAAIVFELVQGEGGIFPMSAEYVRKARELADRYNALLIFDEIQCGVGRPGTYFAYQMLEPVVLPDIMIAAKPMACGIPLGVIAANERAAAAIGPGMHGSTFGGGPLACRVALEFFDILDELMPQHHQRRRVFPHAAQRTRQEIRHSLKRFEDLG